MTEPTAIDGSDGPLVVRRIVVWRRLEPGDVRTPGSELAPESSHLEAKIIEVGIAGATYDDLKRLWDERDEITAMGSGWMTRYEPAGVLFSIGGSMAVGAWLDYLPLWLLPFAGSIAALGAAVGVFTRAMRSRGQREADRRWRAAKEREELQSLERRLKPRWERYAERLKQDTGFRADVRVGDIHEADRLVSINPARITHPDSWKPDAQPNEVRYGWMYADGRVVEQRAELEDDDRASGAEASPDVKADDDETAGDDTAGDEASADEAEEELAEAGEAARSRSS